MTDISLGIKGISKNEKRILDGKGYSASGEKILVDQSPVVLSSQPDEHWQEVWDPIKGGHVGFSPYSTALKIRDIEVREICWEERYQVYEAEF